MTRNTKMQYYLFTACDEYTHQRINMIVCDIDLLRYIQHHQSVLTHASPPRTHQFRLFPTQAPPCTAYVLSSSLSLLRSQMCRYS